MLKAPHIRIRIHPLIVLSNAELVRLPAEPGGGSRDFPSLDVETRGWKLISQERSAFGALKLRWGSIFL